MKNQLDFLAIGDITTDVFIRIKEATVHCTINRENCELCMRFGDKIPYEFVEIVRAVGNSPNAAVSAARLGLSSGAMCDVGDDQNGKECLGALRENNVSVDFVTLHKDNKTNYHYVLWYEEERTILVKHEPFEYAFPKNIVAPRYMYLSSLGENALSYHQEILEFLKANPQTKLAFQPGTFQMKLGYEKLKELYMRTDIFFCNVEEAKKILGTDAADIKVLLQTMRDHGPKLVIITDGPRGAYAFDGTDMWFMPPYPDPKPPYERTGAGDAFASTCTAALALGKSVDEALMWAPINSMSVVQYVGAQKGLLTREKLEEFLKNAPANYKPKKI